MNGVVKDSESVSVSGGDIRLMEIAKNTHNYLLSFLTSQNGKELLVSYGLGRNKMYLIKFSNTSKMFSNILVCIGSIFFPNTLLTYHGIVYSSCEHLYDVLPALRLKITNKCKWYAVYHWVEDYPWIQKRGNTPILTRYVYWLNRWFSGQIIKYFSDEILAVSNQTKKKLINIKKINPQKIKSVYCGVEYERISQIVKKYKNEKGRKYDAVYMNRLNYDKGVFDLLEIWQKVCLNRKDAKLAIIGEGPQEVIKKIKEFIRINNLQNNIFLLGVVYNMEDKFRILNSSKLFIFPSHGENWGIVIGEAMAAKVPVIAYSLKEIKPIWKDNVEWVQIGNINEFSERIIDYLQEKYVRNKLMNKAYKFVVRYDWEDIAKSELNDL